MYNRLMNEMSHKTDLLIFLPELFTSNKTGLKAQFFLWFSL